MDFFKKHEINSHSRPFNERDFNSRIPRYNDDSDYTTNAPSYYDDLARKNALLKTLALRIWEYQEVINKQFNEWDEELKKRFLAWDKNLEEFDDEVLRLLEEWMADGTFEHIINHNIFNELNKKIDDISINVEFCGAKDINQPENANFDSTVYIQNCYNNLDPGQRLFGTGDYLISNLVFDRDDVEVDFRGKLIQKKNVSGAAVTIGDINKYSKSDNIKIHTYKQGVADMSDWIGVAGSIGIEVINVIESTLHIESEGFHTNVLIRGTNGHGTSYNKFHFGRVVTGHTQLIMAVSNLGWVNENEYFGGRFTWDTRFTNVEDKRHLVIPDLNMNQNIFFKPSFEGTRGTYVYINGHTNVLYSPRFESLEQDISVFVELGESSVYNTIMYPYSNDFNEDNYINNGMRNNLYWRDLIETESIIKANALDLKSPRGRHGMLDKATVDITPASTSLDLWTGRMSNGTKTSNINGEGNAEFKNITSEGKIKVHNPISDNSVALEINDSTGAKNIMSVYGSGALYGQLQVATDYMNNHFVPFAVKLETGKPTDNPLKVGITVLNVADSCLYVHMGGGIWKTLTLE